ncbi:hypothetical protein HMPREF1340_02159 [Enterococcus faecalis ERV73]|nr:hypothetical protein HMPREF1340_02159 [Enterococcus faecalis ERV73]
MFYNFWRISAYFRRSWFCSRRLSVLSVEQKSKVIFVPGSCPTFFPNLFIFYN